MVIWFTQAFGYHIVLYCYYKRDKETEKWKETERESVCVCVYGALTMGSKDQGPPLVRAVLLSSLLAERKCSLLISYQMIPIGPDR